MRAPALLLATLLALAGCGAPAAPPADERARPLRIVSLDYCSDQFVLKLADRAQIAALSPDADTDVSYMRAAAVGLKQTRPVAETVLALEPDLVVRAHGGGFNLPALLKQAGVPTAELGYAEDFEGVRANIRAMARAFGHPERGEALIAEMDARLAAAKRAPRGLTALYVTPGGVTTGPNSLVHVLIEEAGLENFEREPGWRSLPLERLARERPDIVVAAKFGQPDAWSPTRHPVAQRQLEERPVIPIEGAWTACGGWFLVDAVEAMAAESRRFATRE